MWGGSWARKLRKAFEVRGDPELNAGPQASAIERQENETLPSPPAGMGGLQLSVGARENWMAMVPGLGLCLPPDTCFPSSWPISFRSVGSLLEMHNLNPPSRPTEPETSFPEKSQVIHTHRTV